MNKFYPQNRFANICHSFKSSILKTAVVGAMMFLTPTVANAQQVFTILDGTSQVNVQAISPFSTNDKVQRSQYMYTGDLLQNQSAPVGYITTVAFKISQLALPSNLKPENVQIKMGLTTDNVLPSTLIPNLPVYYSSAVENITSIGWHTITLDTPMYWDGSSNIVIEVCRSNQTTGSSFEVKAHLGLVGEYLTTGLASNNPNANGCTLEGTTAITLPNRRYLPSMQITMTDPCEANPFPGSIVVSQSSNYCGESFTLSAIDDTVASGLSYQWQYSYSDVGTFINIPGATAPTLTTTQEFATYYRRGVMCDELGLMIFPAAILVTSPECYCQPTVSTQDEAGITNVTFDDINSTSSSSATYTNYYDQGPATVSRTGSYPLSARVTATSTAMTTKAWIDWNHDGTFSASESYNLGTIASGVDVSSGMVANVVVPANAVLGETFMRVRTATVADFDALEPCENTVNGETEDYKIMVDDALGLTNNEVLKNSIIVFGTNKTVNVRSTIEAIDAIKIYDISGRLLYNKSGINSSETSISLPNLASQILIVEVKTTNGFILNKKTNLR